MRGVERKIKAKHDFSLKTYYEEHHLIKDEVKIIRFKNDHTFKALLEFDHFVVANSDEEEVRIIPVLLPEVDESSLVAIEAESTSPPIELINNDDNLEDEVNHEKETRN